MSYTAMGNGRPLTVSRPPVTQRPPGDQGRLPGDGVERVQSSPVVETIGKEVDIRLAGVSPCNPAVLCEEHRLGVVDDRQTILRGSAISGVTTHLRQDSISKVAATVDTVQRSVGTAQIGHLEVSVTVSPLVGPSLVLPSCHESAVGHEAV
jgi:hypothetical protein